MTLDELLERAGELRKVYPGDTPVGCWPHDGQALRDWYFGASVSLDVLRDVNLVVSLHPDTAVTRTVVMLDHDR